jgi:flagellar hook-associated protein 3 FlgL
MTRVSTGSNYSIMTSNLMRAQQRQNVLGEQVASQKVANDLKGYSKNAEVLTAMRSAQAKIDGLIDQTKLVANRLDMQDTGIGQVAGGIQSGRAAIENAMAAGGATLMQQLEAAFGSVTQGVNTKSNGRYVFAGALTDTAPTTANTLADLTAAPMTADLFKNDTYIATNRIDQQTTVQTGVLGDALATKAFDAFKQVQAYVETNGPFGSPLTSAQHTFLEGMVGTFKAAHTDALNTQGKNGLVQKRFENAGVELKDQADTLTGMVGGIVDVDMAEAVTRLEAAQLAVQAAAQVFASLQSSSLLNVLK